MQAKVIPATNQKERRAIPGRVGALVPLEEHVYPESLGG